MLKLMRAFATLAILVLTLLAAAPARAADIEGVRQDICRPVDGRQVCEPMGRDNTSLRGSPEFVLVREVEIASQAVRSDRPIMVVLVAMAASELRWNGVVIGRNGRPGPDKASEVPGRFIAVYVVPHELVRPGRNLATARVSSHHLPLPVVNAVHIFEVADYQDPMRYGLMAYLPALLVIGVLAVAGIYFTVTSLLDRAQKGALLLAGIAWLAVAQLAVETARVFINYAYPWHVIRVGAIAVLAALTAVLVAAWAAQRFGLRRPRLVVGATAVAALAAVAVMPGYDNKAEWAIVAGLAALGLCGVDAIRRGDRAGWVALAGAGGSVGLWLWFGNLFLDGAYYLLVAAALALLVAGQVRTLSRARAGQGAEAARADVAEAALARRDAAMASIRDGTRTHRVATADIVCLRAADDYCDVRLADGRSLLSTASLAQTLETLPGEFLRVHKSWAVNLAHVRAIGPRPGGRRAVTLSDGTLAPVGRTYLAALERLAPA